MAWEPPREEDPEKEGSWKDLLRDVLVAVVIVAIVLGGTYAYTGSWPPLVVVESKSMQHGDQASSLGVIDTGDMVFQQVAPARESVVTYVEGRARNYVSYGDYGDVIIFSTGAGTPIIHRAIMFITLHDPGPLAAQLGTANVPDILLLPEEDWFAFNETGETRNPVGLRNLTIHRMGYRHDVSLTFTFTGYSSTADRSGYVTMGDNNLYGPQCTPPDCDAGYDSLTGIPRQRDVLGRARGEIPWIGLIKLTLQPTVVQIVGAFILAVVVLSMFRTERNELVVLVAIGAWIVGFALMKAVFPSPPTSAACCIGWGDPESPRNSWDSLLLALIGLVALPFVYEVGRRGWVKYVSPRLPPIRWPWSKRKKPPRNSDPGHAIGDPSTWDEPLDGPDTPPREGSSGP